MCGGGRGAGRAWTTRPPARVQVLHTDVPLNPPSRDTTSIRSQRGLKQEEQLCDSLPRPDAAVPLVGHRPPTPLNAPPSSPLSRKNHDSAAFTWNNAEALNLQNANIWDFSLSEYFFFPASATHTFRSSAPRTMSFASKTFSSSALTMEGNPNTLAHKTLPGKFLARCRGSRSPVTKRRSDRRSARTLHNLLVIADAWAATNTSAQLKREDSYQGSNGHRVTCSDDKDYEIEKCHLSDWKLSYIMWKGGKNHFFSQGEIALYGSLRRWRSALSNKDTGGTAASQRRE